MSLANLLRSAVQVGAGLQSSTAANRREGSGWLCVCCKHEGYIETTLAAIATVYKPAGGAIQVPTVISRAE
jgi:hypothetical protein